jgi:hypothetical protein
VPEAATTLERWRCSLLSIDLYRPSCSERSRLRHWLCSVPGAHSFGTDFLASASSPVLRCAHYPPACSVSRAPQYVGLSECINRRLLQPTIYAKMLASRESRHISHVAYFAPRRRFICPHLPPDSSTRVVPARKKWSPAVGRAIFPLIQPGREISANKILRSQDVFAEVFVGYTFPYLWRKLGPGKVPLVEGTPKA